MVKKKLCIIDHYILKKISFYKKCCKYYNIMLTTTIKIDYYYYHIKCITVPCLFLISSKSNSNQIRPNSVVSLKYMNLLNQGVIIPTMFTSLNLAQMDKLEKSNNFNFCAKGLMSIVNM